MKMKRTLKSMFANSQHSYNEMNSYSYVKSDSSVWGKANSLASGWDSHGYAHTAGGFIAVSSNMRVLLSHPSPDGMLAHRRTFPQRYAAGRVERDSAEKSFFVKLKVKLSLISCNVDTVYDQAYCYIDCDILHKMGASFESHVRKDIFPWMIFEKRKSEY